jgi:hypothetical protein
MPYMFKNDLCLIKAGAAEYTHTTSADLENQPAHLCCLLIICTVLPFQSVNTEKFT